MNLIKFEKIAEKMGSFYGKSLTSGQKDIWFDKLSYVRDDDAEHGLELLISYERQFPTPATFLRYADDARAKRAFRELDKDKAKSSNFIQPNKHRDGLAKDCVTLMFSTKTTKQFYDGMLLLEKIYPNLGFKQEAERYKKEVELLANLPTMKEMTATVREAYASM